MDLMRRFSGLLARVMILAMVLASLPAPAVYAGMLGTNSVLEEPATTASERARVDAFLAREDVSAALRAQGVDPMEARIRAESLTDGEVRQLAGQLDQLPAGGDAVGAIVGALVFVFIVLLITDLLGLTNVFPFVNR